MSASLTWMLVKNNNCFLRKQRHSGGHQLSLEPYNLDNKNRFTSSGLVNGKAVDISSGEGGITMKLKGKRWGSIYVIFKQRYILEPTAIIDHTCHSSCTVALDC